MARAVTQTATGLRKSAILMVLLGEKVASNVFRTLPSKEVGRIAREISALGPISPEMASATVEEYKKALTHRKFLTKGDSDFAHKVLSQAFGEAAGGSLLEQVMKSADHESDQGASLQTADPEQLAKLLEEETPQTVALVVANLGAKGASVLANLPELLRPEVVERVAKMRHFAPEVVQRVLAVLQKKVGELGREQHQTFGGVPAVAGMLKSMTAAASKSILESLEALDGDLANSVRSMMFTFEDLLDVPSAGMREVLGQADKKVLATAMKGASEEVVAHISQAMSSRAAEMLKEDMEAIGPLRARDVQAAQQQIADLARKLESEGKLTRKGVGEDEYAA